MRCQHALDNYGESHWISFDVCKDERLLSRSSSFRLIPTVVVWVSCSERIISIWLVTVLSRPFSVNAVVLQGSTRVHRSFCLLMILHQPYLLFCDHATIHCSFQFYYLPSAYQHRAGLYFFECIIFLRSRTNVYLRLPTVPLFNASKISAPLRHLSYSS